jgi:flagellar biosynthesis component FlhA
MDDFLGSIGDIVETGWPFGLAIILVYYFYKYNKKKKPEEEKEANKRTAKRRTTKQRAVKQNAAKQFDEDVITIEETKTTKIKTFKNKEK